MSCVSSFKFSNRHIKDKKKENNFILIIFYLSKIVWININPIQNFFIASHLICSQCKQLLMR